MRCLHLLVGIVFGAVAVAGCAPVGDLSTPQEENGPGKRPIVRISKYAPDGTLKDRIQEVLKGVAERELLPTHGFWTVFHALLGNGLETKIHDPISGKEYRAIDYIAQGGHVRGMRFLPQPDGTVDVEVKREQQFDSQGHTDQFVAEMAQIGMPLDRKFLIDGKTYDFADFVRHTKTRASTDQELSWTILVLAHYYGTDISWTNNKGEKLHYEDLLRAELNEPVEKGACGGTHRLFGLTWAYHLHLKKGGKKTELWQQVEKKIKDYQARAKEVQNADGSFSTDYFVSKTSVPDLERQIGCTGHILEWLALSLPDEEIHAPWVQEAAHALVRLMLDGRNRSLDGGALYHAAHGLRLYYLRAFDDPRAAHNALVLPLPPKLPVAPRGS